MITKSKSKLEYYLPIALVVVFLITGAASIYNTEYTKKPVVREKVNLHDADYLYRFYVSATPNIQNREYLGNPNASIFIIDFIDINSNSSRYFISEIFPKLKEEYIDSGKARFYHKNYITKDDFIAKNERFIYAQALACVIHLKKEVYYNFYFNLFELNSTDEIPTLLGKYNISLRQFADCMQNNQFENIIEDYSEAENFGMVGISPRFYVGIDDRANTIINGIPKYDKFKKAIREYEILLGY